LLLLLPLPLPPLDVIVEVVLISGAFPRCAQAKKKNRKKAKAEAEKIQVDDDDALLEAALGEKQRILTTIERKREEAMGEDFARRLQEKEWAAADAAAAAIARGSESSAGGGAAQGGDDADLAAAIALSMGGTGGGSSAAATAVDLRTAQDQEYAAALARDLQRQTEVVRANTPAGDEELRLMRERRAKAAEARLVQNQQQDASTLLCDQCGGTLGADRFSRDEKRFCSTACVRAYAARQ